MDFVFCRVWMCLGWHLKKDDFGILDFADLYDVRPGEIDFLGVIKILKEKDNLIKHLDKEYIEFIKHI